jgi:hypothetical protein
LIVYGFTSRSRIFHLHGDVTLPMKGCKILGFAQRSGPLSREGSLSCHTCCDMGPRFFRSNLKDQWTFTTHKEMWRTYYNPDPHGDAYISKIFLKSSKEPQDRKSLNLHESVLTKYNSKFVKIMAPGGRKGPQ